MIITILIMTNVFFVFCIIAMLSKQKKQSNIRMEGISLMVQVSQELREKRAESIGKSPSLKHMNKQNIDEAWICEVEFYQNISEVICFPTDDNIKNVPMQVTDLIEPYLSIEAAQIIEKKNQENSFQDREEDQNNSEDTEVAIIEDDGTAKNSDEIRDNIENELKTLEERYQLKIQENEKLLKKIDELKSQSTAEVDTDHEKTKKALEQYQILMIDTLNLLNQLNGESSEVSNGDDPQKTATMFTTSLNTLIEKYHRLSATYHQDVLKQLRSERIEAVKRYRQAMALLLKICDKYAESLNLETPQPKDIDIEKLEASIQLD